MFTALIGAIVEASLWLSGIYILYRVLFANTIKADSNFKLAQSTAEKMAIVKLLSNSSKEISEFLNSNTQFLTIDTVKKLAEKLEMIRIIGDEDVSNKFENLERRQRVDEASVEETENAEHYIKNNKL
jgi:aconitase B